MQFPHLSDTPFPNLPTVNVYQFQNKFDYSRWSEKTHITLCNVIWNSDYTDVVKWQTNEARDSWFDSLDDIWTLELQQSARVVPDGFIKLPIPYDVMARYNYIFVDMPIATSADNPIDYESSDGIRRWYFFVNTIQYLAPNATQVYVVPDVWTNFQNDVEINYMLLERGHAPVAYSDTDSYLANPIGNNRYLLAPDVNYDNAGITRSSSYVPFGNGIKWVCFATTVTPNLIATLGSVFPSQEYAPSGNITYTDDSHRYGHQLIVDGLTMGNGYDYSDANTPAAVGTSDGLIANNLTVYAIPAIECYGQDATFFEDIITTCPQFLTTVRGCFVVDDACITLGGPYQIAGHTVYQVEGRKSTLLEKALTKADFDFPQELQRFAKLYTAPYSQLEITDNDGTTYTVNVEETTTLSVRAVVSLAFPYINERVYVDGIGGIGSTSYRWTDLRGRFEQLEMPNADWFKYCFDWGIPTFALYMDGQTAYMLETFNRNVKQAIRQSLVSYHNTMRSANTAYENACDQADVAYANTTDNADTAKSNSDRSALTGKTNAYNIADTNKAITDRSADTAKTNSYNSANTEKQNADNAADTTKSNADRSADTAHTNAYNSAGTERTNADNAAGTNRTNAYNDADAAYNIVDRTCTTADNNLTDENDTIQNIEETEILASNNITNVTDVLSAHNLNYSNALVQYTTSTDVERSTSAATWTNVGNYATGTLSGAASGAVMAATVGGTIGSALMPGIGTAGGIAIGTALGALGGAATAGINATVNNLNTGLTTNTAQSIATAQTNYNQQMYTVTLQATLDTNRYKNDTRRYAYRTRRTLSEAKMTRSNVTSRANASDTRTTAKANADNAYNTATTNNANSETTAKTNADNVQTASKTNALDTQTTSKTNATNTQTNTKTNADNTNATTKANATDAQTTTKANADNTYASTTANAAAVNATTKANADRTKVNVQDNAGYTREVAELNAKEILENGKYSAMAAIMDARNSAPVECCPYSGNPAPDYMRTRGVQIKVKTQGDSAIRQAGDTFARFGYALNQIWDVGSTGLTLMRNFTYWKAAEIWIDDKESSNNAVNNIIHTIFLNGVTVWSDPTKIGKVSVYDN